MEGEDSTVRHEVNLVDKLVGEDYRACYAIASSLYADEQARQACCATLLIQYVNVRKTNVKLKEALDSLEEARKAYVVAMERYESDEGKRSEEEIQHISDEEKAEIVRSMRASFARTLYEPLEKVCPKAGLFLTNLLASYNWTTLDDIDAHMRDYMARNGHTFTLNCQLGINPDSMNGSVSCHPDSVNDSITCANESGPTGNGGEL